MWKFQGHHIYKVVASIIKIRLELVEFRDYQVGFRKGRSNTDQMFIMKEVVVTGYEFKNSAVILFNDCKKGSNSIRRNNLGT